MMQCVAAGHRLVALANLRPAHTGEKETLLGFSRALQLEKMGQPATLMQTKLQGLHEVLQISVLLYVCIYVTLCMKSRISDVQTCSKIRSLITVMLYIIFLCSYKHCNYIKAWLA